MRLFNLIIVIVLMLVSLNINAQGRVSSKTNIKKGKLSNGLTYYLYNNPVSRGKVNFYLIQNVGAILEEDNQNGLAHFLEHMCFKGTKHFPGRSIMNLFEKKGLSSSINAYTQVEETVYHLNNIPIDDKIFLDKCLLVLYDWCNYLNLEQEAIDSERPVIVEELRTRRDVKERILEQISLVTHNHSKYSKRFVSGLPEIIKNFKRETLVEFYTNWYRADLQAVAVVGDIDIFDMEEKIKNLFSTIPPFKDVKPRDIITIQENSGTLYVAAKDKEVKDGEISINFRHKKDNYKLYKEKTYNDFVINMINFMFKNRIATLLEEDKDNFVGLNIGSYSLTQGYDNYSIRVVHNVNKAKEALSAAIALHKDVIENGFTEEEFEKVKRAYSKSLEKYKHYQNGLGNDIIFNKIKSNFIQKENILDASTEYKMFKDLIKKLTLEDLTAKVRELYSGQNKGIVVICNNKDNRYLTKEEILGLEETVVSRIVLPKDKEAEEKKESKVVKNKIDLKGSEIIKVERIKNLDAERWTLANGATVVFKENEYTRDIINVAAVSSGGLSLLDGDDLLNGRIFNSFKSCIGIEGYNKENYTELLKNNQLLFDFNISNDSEEIICGCKYSKVDKMFDVLYKLFESPEFYNESYKEIIDNINKSLEGRGNKFSSLLRDSVLYLSGVKGRNLSLNKERVKNISSDKIYDIYKARFSDASNFTFYIVGGIGKAKAKKLAEKYIGAIKSTNSNESFRKFENPICRKYIQKRLKFDMVDEKAGNILFLAKYLNVSTKEKISYRIIQMFLQEKLNKLLREKLNGTYGVRVSNIVTKRSLESCRYEISYECDPARLNELNSALLEMIKVLGNRGMNESDYNKFIKALNKPGVPRPDNRYYTGLLRSYIESGEDRSDKDYVKNIFDSISYDYINNLVKNYLSECNKLDILYLPR